MQLAPALVEKAFPYNLSIFSQVHKVFRAIENIGSAVYTFVTAFFYSLLLFPDITFHFHKTTSLRKTK